MSKSDTLGRKYVLLSRIKIGDTIIADDGFVSDHNGKEIHCITLNRKCVVKYSNGFYVRCFHGRHYLE